MGQNTDTDRLRWLSKAGLIERYPNVLYEALAGGNELNGFRAWIDDAMELEKPCEEHSYKTHRNPNTPDEPGDVIVYCIHCGMENQEND